MINLILKIRALFFRMLFPRGNAWQICEKPLSVKYGYDRGLPIERYYIEKFLSENGEKIKGLVLEVESDQYATRFGGKNISSLEIVDYNSSNKKANYIDDLQFGKKLPKEYYDCVLITQVIGAIADYNSFVNTVFDILKPGGNLILTTSGLATMIKPPQEPFWRFTPKGLKMIFEKKFKTGNTYVESFGNFLTGQASWIGASAQELSTKELDQKDDRYPVLIGLIATKPI